jgi:hypothetical protein
MGMFWGSLLAGFSLSLSGAAAKQSVSCPAFETSAQQNVSKISGKSNAGSRMLLTAYTVKLSSKFSHIYTLLPLYKKGPIISPSHTHLTLFFRSARLVGWWRLGF